MSKLGKEALQSNRLEVVADRGYFRGEEVLACDEDNIITYLPKPLTSGNRKRVFTQRETSSITQMTTSSNVRRERLIWRFRTHKKGQTNDKYWSSNRPKASNATLYPPQTQAQHAGDMKLYRAMESRLDHEPERMRVRVNRRASIWY